MCVTTCGVTIYMKRHYFVDDDVDCQPIHWKIEYGKDRQSSRLDVAGTLSSRKAAQTSKHGRHRSDSGSNTQIELTDPNSVWILFGLDCTKVRGFCCVQRIYAMEIRHTANL